MNDDKRPFKFLMKNVENKLRRLTEYKLRYNKVFDQKRQKNDKNYKRTHDPIFEKRKGGKKNLEPFPAFKNLSDT